MIGHALHAAVIVEFADVELGAEPLVDPIEQSHTEDGVQAVAGKGFSQGDLGRVQVERLGHQTPQLVLEVRGLSPVMGDGLSHRGWRRGLRLDT